MKTLTSFLIPILFLGLTLSFSGCGTDANPDGEEYSATVEFRFSGGTHVTRANGDYVAEVVDRETTIPGLPELLYLNFTDYNFSIGRSFIPTTGVEYQIDVVLEDQNRYRVLRTFVL